MSENNSKDPFALQSDLDDYLQMIVEQKNYSILTQKNYQRQLALLTEFLTTLRIASWSQVKPIHIRQLSAQQHRRGKSAKSIALLLSSCRSFFQFLIANDLLQSNPAKNVRPPKGEKKLPKTMDVDQVSLLLDNIDDSEAIGIRDKAIAELFYSSGLRLAELADCDLQQIDLNQQLITVTGKGNKTRVVPVGRKAKIAVLAWLKVRSVWMVERTDQALFVSQRRTRLSHRSIQKRLEYWGKRIGLNASLHPHKFRHSCATHVLESSGDIRAVQELLGHANLSTTQVYTHLDFQKLAAVYDKAHPRAKK
jgi:integrase/recombinase XerC